MSWSVIVMALGAFLAGGTYSFHKQGFPRYTVVIMGAAAAALIIYGAFAWFTGSRAGGLRPRAPPVAAAAGPHRAPPRSTHPEPFVEESNDREHRPR